MSKASGWSVRESDGAHPWTWYAYGPKGQLFGAAKTEAQAIARAVQAEMDLDDQSPRHIT